MMSRSPVTKIFLPTVSVTLGLFTLMMLLFVLFKDPKENISDRQEMAMLQEKAWLLPTQRSYRQIRQVGLALMISTSAGMLTAEGLRRWYAFRDLGQTKAKQLGLEEFLREVELQSEEKNS